MCCDSWGRKELDTTERLNWTESILLCVLSAQSCPTLYNPTNCSMPGSSVDGILQARILEWVAISFSGGSSQPRDWTRVSRIAADSLQTELPGKPKYIGVGSLSLLQGGTSWPRNPTMVSCIAGVFFTRWTTREALVWLLRYGAKYRSRLFLLTFVCHIVLLAFIIII